MELVAEQNEQLHQLHNFGNEVASFLATDVGRYLVQCADREIAEADRELRKIWPWRTRRIRDLQNCIWRAESVKSWLEEAMRAGEQARTLLEDE